MISSQTFRDQLSALVDLLGYSQREVADYCGVSQQSVSRWRSGASIPSPTRIADLAPVLDQLEEAARERLQDGPTQLPLQLARFLRDRKLDPALAELFPPPPGTDPVTEWNNEYQALVDDLVSRVPLLQVTVPLGHGISTLARDAEARMRTAMSDVICVRLSIEGLTAFAADPARSERDVYGDLFYAAYDPESEVSPPRPSATSVVSARRVPSAVGDLLRERVEEDLRRDEYRRILGTSRHEAVLDLLASPSDGWRAALEHAGMSVQVVVLLDLSPSPGGRIYEQQRDRISPDHAARAQAMVDAVATEAAGLPRVTFSLVRPSGDETDLAVIEGAHGSATWEVLPSPSRLQRGDLFAILAAHARTSRVELEAAVSPRFAPDLLERGIASTVWDFTTKLNAALSHDVDHAGVVRERDLSSADAVVIGRMTNLERQVHQLEETQAQILDAIGDLRRVVAALR